MGSPTTDRGGIQQTIRALTAAGWNLTSVYDGEEDMTVTKEGEALDNIMAVDQAWLYVTEAGTGRQAWVFFVLGNSPEEVVSDYTLNLEDVLDPLTKSWWD